MESLPKLSSLVAVVVRRPTSPITNFRRCIKELLKARSDVVGGISGYTIPAGLGRSTKLDALGSVRLVKDEV